METNIEILFRVDDTVLVPEPIKPNDTWDSSFVTKIDDINDDGTVVLTDDCGIIHQINISRLKFPYTLKDKKLFKEKNKVCYVPETREKGYKYSDFLDIAKGNETLAEILFDLCEWQHPETIFQEMLIEGEIDETGKILID